MERLNQLISMTAAATSLTTKRRRQSPSLSPFLPLSLSLSLSHTHSHRLSLIRSSKRTFRRSRMTWILFFFIKRFGNGIFDLFILKQFGFWIFLSLSKKKTPNDLIWAWLLFIICRDIVHRQEAARPRERERERERSQSAVFDLI
jgi:hypothetical protein